MIKKRDSSSLLGAIGMGLCPVLMATALSTIGLGVLAPIWMWLSGALLVAGLVGYALDYRYHRQSAPVILFVVGGLLLWGWALFAAGRDRLARLAVMGQRRPVRTGGLRTQLVGTLTHPRSKGQWIVMNGQSLAKTFA